MLMKRTPLKRSTKPMKRTAFKTRRKKASIELPPWFRSLTPGSHGSTLVQKKAWKFISDMVRKEDFETYGGKCVSCERRLNDWSEGDCAHWISWTNCNGLFKFNTKNLALSCKACNHINDGSIGYEFAEELKRRHGEDVLLELSHSNAKHHGSKLYDADVLALVTYFYEKGYGEIHHTS
jgi:hypothetical protein